MQVTTEEIIYPSSDGQPMAESTIQYKLIVTIKEGCESLFENDPNVFVAADLLWYPVEGRPDISQAPDTMVVFGRPKGDRPSYIQSREENIPPQVVFEIRSHNDSNTKMNKKLSFYYRYGVEEYYVYDPEKNQLEGWQRIEGILEPIEPMEGWISPRLGVRFELPESGLEIYRPDGERFLSYSEINAERLLERRRAEQEFQRAEQEFQRAEQESQRAEQESQRAEQEFQRAEQEALKAQQAAQNSQLLAAKLRELNIDPDSI
ncbi:MAG: Uma2 family endonuclease [Microcoleus sp. PH2017_10_PVI_O_A]|uniref:Uma2 family endonuclease n=1 Tax=unclassified Microcoleus TaxID=2642155 RepID=UPI001D245595|nr:MULTISPECIES: Uma2 family endonuclease [unclassified Microcoleus]TAE81040.1 MAG: Uma2 family endonuclease [Oscillatoriales cyanobacterium]MCC3407339.1 Uma2 family endonuclease [Microcoleus sp. PH2017_10_PVI_O_A]MCC3461395.1 Uma2 family endonuclease [Microcoleus sp. PH2017_11_PCY_U_A]MCC3479870.1 Uma2 family endonuclease [Microcoleus sp. PH2017_12_PCY_D_A]MCC3560798.1 Uma2 family endonuclease [Microcoleus sp. PH2017_27_LUM_O_A]